MLGLAFMFGFGCRQISARYRALCELYNSFFDEKTPEACGRRLLREWLSAEQRAQFDEFGHFDVVGCHTGVRYRIYYGTISNVQQTAGTGEAQRLCFIPKGSLVAGDVMLAQKIGLETDELGVLAIANRFAAGAPPPLPQWAVRRAC